MKGAPLLHFVFLLAGAFPLLAAEKAEKGPAPLAKKETKEAKREAAKVEKKEEKKEAAKDAKKAEEPPAPPSDNLAIPSDLPEKARKFLEEAIASFREAEKTERGRNILLDKSIEKLKGSSQSAAKSPLPFYYLGIAYQWKRSFPEAKRVLEKAVKLNPRFHEAFLELADVHVWQKDLKGSLAIYDKALAIQPSFPQALMNRAFALIRLGQFQDAKPCLDKAQKLAPSDNLLRFARMLEGEIKGPGWETTFTAESKNFKVVTSISQEFADEFAKQAELMRRAYDKVFPGLEKPKRKFPIWIYKDREAYLKGGGPPMAGGHYDTIFRKLVLYSYPKKQETIAVLYHEAFHQYLHDYLEEAPQWFNEGLADYFGAFEYVKKGADERMVPRPNRERLRWIKAVIPSSDCPSAAELMVMTQAEMYNPSMVHVHYAQAWALIYFIAEGDKPQYKNILVNYYKALEKGLDLNAAYLATFGKIDMGQFDRDWKGFIKGVK